MAEFYRSFEAQLEIRSAAQGGDGRTVYGAAVPFDLPKRIEHEDIVEEWDRGAFNHQLGAIHRVPLYHGHRVHGGKHVGHLTMARPDAKHLYVEGRVSKTRDGDDYLEMVRDGSTPDFSVGFTVGPQGTVVRNRVHRRVKADLTEVAGVPIGAFGSDAAVAGVRALTTVDNGSGLVQPHYADDADHVSALMDLLADCTPQECARLGQLAEQMVAEGSHQ